MHWADQCQHNDKIRPVHTNVTCTCSMDKSHSSATQQNLEFEYSSDEDVEEVHFVLMTSDIDKNEIFVAEASKSAVLDTACTKTVCGDDWFEDFCENLPPSYQKEIEITPSHTKFVFGDGKTVRAFQKAKVPIVIAGLKMQLETEVIRKKIPLLVSKSSLKRAGTVIDMKSGTARCSCIVL